MTEANQNAAEFFVERHRAGAAAEKPAFIEAGGARQLSYRQLAEQSDQMAELYRRHGIHREDRAIMLVLDTIEFPVIFWGSLKAGIVPVPLNTLLSADIYRTIFADSRARALFVSEPLLAIVGPLLGELEHIEAVFVIGSGNLPEGTITFANALEACEATPLLAVLADECAFWLYSSGSTGTPKGVCHAHGNLKATYDTYGAKVLGVKSDDVVFSVAKLFFAYGLGNSMTFPMAVGATSILLAERPTPQSAFSTIAEHSPTIFFGVPTLYAALVAAMTGKRPGGFERLRLSVSAGEALPTEIGRNWRKITGADILDGVGSTEMLHIFLSNRPDDVNYGTSGQAVPGYEIRLVDENGAAVKPGEIGELLVSGPSAASNYWNQRDKSRTTFEGMWTRTGDKYEAREDGRLIYCGRTDDMFKVSGIWVSPFEVEQALSSHPAVLESAVVAARDEDGLEKPKAFVVLVDGAHQDGLNEALKSHVQNKIGKWKYPRWIEFSTELPKTSTGKIQRFKLRASDG